MPIHVYQCFSSDQNFEILVPSSDPKAAVLQSPDYPLQKTNKHLCVKVVKSAGGARTSS